MRRRTFRHVRPTKTQINLRICMKKLCILDYPKCVKWRFWSDCANAQADLNLRWAQMLDSTFSDDAVMFDGSFSDDAVMFDGTFSDDAVQLSYSCETRLPARIGSRRDRLIQLVVHLPREWGYTKIRNTQYRVYPKYSDRHVWANSADTAQTPRSRRLNRVCTVCHPGLAVCRYTNA